METIRLQDIQEAALRLKPHVHRTPVLSSETLNLLCGRKLFFKAEHLQKTGSFKVRGAMNAALQLQAPRGLLTRSSGNHAQGVAFAARTLGLPCTVVMYEDASEVKKQAVRSYGATVVDAGVTHLNADQKVQELMDQTGFTFIHAYENLQVMAGQGTQALELIGQMEAPDAVLVAVGGGGMISGIATVLKSLWPDTQVIGVEPELGNDAQQSLRAGRRVSLAAPPETLADAVRPMSPGVLTFPVMQRLVDDILTVQEETILQAQHLMMRHLKQVVEPTAALPLAAVLEHFHLPERLALFVCGGNWLPE
ncbi:threonine/serine dehydratase [Deinococcus cellulosilyticus]|uniref:Serine/threonine dehydratase n=1 Tax=Deinococcus cellulosilyticus (strain DSM 18568 / NBRC 106333 / KACC 11606 / 5516J-15) TaxID=1223518 RepID=A0A511N7S5_DEIC1|nr:threonine/serine dehydratase [Deinococcus cellulosilyticus]GEM48889.1 serine/threonine dehydratase [Deinococcus cellulosilyticus NBRC 106333 = KACC 11606]